MAAKENDPNILDTQENIAAKTNHHYFDGVITTVNIISREQVICIGALKEKR